MDPMVIVAQEARAGRTVMLTAREADGSVETREVEPYSLRPGPNGQRLFYWCCMKQGMRNTYLSNILSAELTGRTFVPRFSVEF
jgi:predicted DNA-binding transcriptional regulator YafY